MGIMSHSGFSKQVSQELNNDLGHGPDFPDTTSKSAPDIDDLKDPVGDLENRDFVKDPGLQQTATSTEQYPNSYSQIQAYMQGHQVTCIYYSRFNVNEGIRSNQVDSPYLKNTIHAQWIRIDQLVMTLTEGFQYNPDTERGESELTLVARWYPGVITPKVGDQFIMTAGDQREFVFVVSTVTPQSWRNMRCYQLGAYSISTLDQYNYDVLNRAVMRRYTFSLANLAEGNKALLTSNDAQGQSALQQARQVLPQRYFQLFYNRDFNTLMRPDGYYDPYVVRFVNDQTDIPISKWRCRQLFYAVDQSYDKTIYSRLENNDSHDLDLIYSKAVPEWRRNVITDAYFTLLSGRGYLTMDYPLCSPEEGGPPWGSRIPYVCSQGFYDGNIPEMSAFERFLYDSILSNSVSDYDTLLNVYVNNWKRLTPMEQFYRIPIYVWLIDRCLNTITKTTS